MSSLPPNNSSWPNGKPKFFKPQYNDFYQEKFVPTPRSARSARGESDFQSLFELAANKLGIGGEMKAIRICHQARQTLSKLFPDQSSKFQVISYKNGTLNLSASNSSERQRLFTKKHLLQEALNQALGADTIQKITIRSS